MPGMPRGVGKGKPREAVAIEWLRLKDSNLRPAGYGPVVLTAELSRNGGVGLSRQLWTMETYMRFVSGAKAKTIYF